MTDEIENAIDNMDDEPDDEHNPEESDSDGENPGGSTPENVVDRFLPELSGTGKPLDHYEDHPFRSLAGGTGGDVDAEELQDKGEKHLARGMDGLVGGFVDAGHPFIDLAIGFVLVSLGGKGSSSDDDNEGYDGSELGEENMDDTPGVEQT